MSQLSGTVSSYSVITAVHTLSYTELLCLISNKKRINILIKPLSQLIHLAKYELKITSWRSGRLRVIMTKVIPMVMSSRWSRCNIRYNVGNPRGWTPHCSHIDCHKPC